MWSGSYMMYKSQIVKTNQICSGTSVIYVTIRLYQIIFYNMREKCEI